MNLLKKIRSLPYLALAVVTVEMLDMASAQAADAAGGAASTVGDAATKIGEQVGSIGKMALSGMFLIGVFFFGAGLMKLKQAADTNGQQVKYGEGMWRLAVGAGLVAIPAASGILTNSLGLGSVAPNGTDSAPF